MSRTSMRVNVLLIAIFIQVPVFFFTIPAEAQVNEPEIELDCGYEGTSYPFEYTYGVGMDYHTPIVCGIENPNSYVVEIEISWTWQWQVEITDEDGDAIDETQQIDANGNLTILLEISSPHLQKIGDYEIGVAAIVKKYGAGQNAMTDCSSCEEESTTETVVIHPYYFFSRELVDTHQWRDGWKNDDWSYTADEQKDLPGTYPDCPQGLFWSVFEFTIQANHDGYFVVEAWMGEEHEAWLLDSDGSKISLDPQIRYETGNTVSFKIKFEWNMTSIIESHSTYELDHYSIYFWWNGYAEMDNKQYSSIRTYHPNHEHVTILGSGNVWRDITPAGSGGYLQEMSAMPCWGVEDIEHAEDTNVNAESNDVPALSFPSTIMIILLSVILVRRNG
ncbi:MAG: hypothetical protein VX473_05275 [Candidatus Thermoplasmatota archaeon]|nr:hypothetical protein [Candidatus Thermoplasmatota archaeon]